VLAASDAPQTDFASTAFDHQAMSFEAAPSAGAAPQGSTWGVGPAPSAASAPPPVAGQPPRPAAGAPIPQSDTALKLALAGLVALIVLIAAIILIGLVTQVTSDEAAADEASERFE